MAATPAAAARDPPPAEVRRRISKTGGGAGPARDAAEERPPVNKKVKLAYPGTATGVINSAAEETPRFVGGDWRMGGDRVAPQHNNHAPPPPPTAGLATANIGANTTGRATQTTAQRFLDPKSLQNLRETISQQFDIEILLKHRELGLIEQEIAKTQICIEQLRRCTIKPYQSPEKSLEPYIPDAKELENGPPDYSPPHWSVVNGPYTRHYQQWLLPDPTFDGYGPEGPPVVLPAGKSTRSQKTVEPTQTYTVSGRPQRQSVMKVQARSGTGVQQCLFRKSDGTTVRLECLDCKRSDFSSAQGFINHCRIAHQREYASHEAAALACGQPVEETEEGFALYPRNPVDPPSRNTRQTQQAISPQSSYSSTPRGSISGPSGAPVPGLLPPKVAPTPKNKTTAAQRKTGNRGTRAVMTTASRPVEGSRRPPTPPIDALTFKTPHLEGLLKRKKIEVDLATMVKEVKGQRINWDDHASSEEDDDESDQPETPVSSGKDTDGDTVMTDGPAEGGESKQARSPLETETHTAVVAAQPESLTVASARNMSRDSPTPFSAQLPSPPELKTQKQPPPPSIDISFGHPKQASAMMQSPIEEKKPLLSLTGMGMDGSYDYDASSSDDEDGYKSDADVHEDVEMEVESASSSSSIGDHTTIHDTGFGMRTPPVPVERMGRSSSPQSPRPVASHVAVVAPISPALSVAADEIMRDMVTPVRPLMQIPTPLMTPISPAAAANNSKQVRFVMPNSKNGMRKNPSGVLETGLAKMKSGNARRPSDVFGSQEKR